MFNLTKKQYGKEMKNYRKTYIGRQLFISKTVMEILFFLFVGFAIFECFRLNDTLIMELGVNDIFFLGIDLVCLVGIVICILRNEGIDFEVFMKYLEKK